MRIELKVTNTTGTRIDKELEINTNYIEDIFAELAQGIKWARQRGAQRIELEVTNLVNNFHKTQPL